jgi:hypothetical protein
MIGTLVTAMTSGGANHAPGLVVLACCDSKDIAGQFITAGSKFVVCFKGEIMIGTLASFTKAFMRNLRLQKNGKDLTIREAFDMTKAQYHTLQGAGGTTLWEAILRTNGPVNTMTLKDLMR